MVEKQKGIIYMYDYKIVEQISRKKKSMSGVLRKVMVLFAEKYMKYFIMISQIRSGFNSYGTFRGHKFFIYEV